MATSLTDYQKIRTDLLHLIRWKDNHGQENKLRLYTVLSSMWEEVSDLLMLDPHMKKSIADKRKDNPEKCIRDVIEKWMQDEKSLSPNYKCTWNGLCLLLEHLEQSTAASDLKAALAANISSFINNLDEEAMPEDKSYETRKVYKSSSRKLIKPFWAAGFCADSPLNAKARDLKFPGLNLEELGEEEKQDLNSTLSEESYSLAVKFMEILLKFYSYIEEKAMYSMPMIQTLLNNFFRFPPMYDDKQNSTLNHFTSGVTIQDISEFINRYCSFFNYDLLKQIFTRIKYQNGLESLEHHDRDLEEYAKRRICHFPSGVGMLSDYVVVAVKLDDMYEGCSILHLLRFHKKLCEILKVTLALFDIVFPLSEDVIDMLKETKCNSARIKNVSCGTFLYHFQEEAFERDTLKEFQVLDKTDSNVQGLKQKSLALQQKDLLQQKEKFKQLKESQWKEEIRQLRSLIEHQMINNELQEEIRQSRLEIDHLLLQNEQYLQLKHNKLVKEVKQLQLFMEQLHQESQSEKEIRQSMLKMERYLEKTEIIMELKESKLEEEFTQLKNFMEQQLKGSQLKEKIGQAILRMQDQLHHKEVLQHMIEHEVTKVVCQLRSLMMLLLKNCQTVEEIRQSCFRMTPLLQQKEEYPQLNESQLEKKISQLKLLMEQQLQKSQLEDEIRQSMLRMLLELHPLKESKLKGKIRLSLLTMEHQLQQKEELQHLKVIQLQEEIKQLKPLIEQKQKESKAEEEVRHLIVKMEQLQQQKEVIQQIEISHLKKEISQLIYCIDQKPKESYVEMEIRHLRLLIEQQSKKKPTSENITS